MSAEYSIAKRDESLDFLRGIAILFVVIGHVIEAVISPENYGHNLLFRIAYSFHIPLFFFVSGFLVGNRFEKNTDWIKKKIKNILWPWFLWTLILGLCEKFSFSNIIYRLVINQSIWFLFCLFCFHLFYYISGKLNKKYFSMICFWCANILLFVIFRIEFMKDIILFLPYYILGIWFKGQKDKSYYKKLMIAALFLYPVSLLFYGYPDYLFFCKKIQCVINIPSAVLLPALKIYSHTIVPILAIMSLWIISHKISKIFIFKTISFVGNYTIEIYILSQLFQRNWTNNRYIAGVISITLGIVVPILISYLLRKKRNSRINMFLFGK